MENNKSTVSNNSFSVKVIKNTEGLEELRSKWKRESRHHFSDIDFYLTIIHHREEVIMPYVIVLYRDGNIETIVVGRIEKQRLINKIGYKVVYQPKARFLYIEYGGILGNLSHKNTEIVVDEVMKALSNSEADIALFSSLPVNSSIFRTARTKPGFLCRDYISLSSEHWKTILPETFENFLKTMSQKHRYWIRRMERLIQKDCEAEIAFKIFRYPDQVQQFCQDVEEIAKTSYQRGIGVGFMNNDEMRHRLDVSASQHWFRGYVLYLGDQPIAYWLASLYWTTLYLDGTGYKPAYRKYEPGTVLFMKMVESLYMSNEKAKEIDFGFGGASYKERYGSQYWNEANVFIFAPTLRSIRFNLVRFLILAISKSAEAFLKRTRLISKVKRYWRDRSIS